MKHRGVLILSIITILLCLWESKGILNIYLRYGDIYIGYTIFILIGFLAGTLGVLNKPLFIPAFYIFYGMQCIFVYVNGYMHKFVAGYGYHISFSPTPDPIEALNNPKGFAVNIIGVISIIIISKVFKSYQTHNKSLKQDK